MAKRRRLIPVTELHIVGAILGVLAIIAIPSTVSYSQGARRQQLGIDCLEELAAAAEGKRSAKCPATDRVAVEDGGFYRCPYHLQPPTSLRNAGGLVSLQQELPPSPALVNGTFRGSGVSVELESRRTTLLARVRHRWWIRWLAAPLIALICLASAGSLFWEYRESGKQGASTFACIAFCLAVAAVGIGYLHRTVHYEIDGLDCRVTRRVTVFGTAVGAPEIHEDVLAIAAVKAGDHSALVALTRRPGGFEGVEIVRIPEDSIGAAVWFQETLPARR